MEKTKKMTFEEAVKSVMSEINAGNNSEKLSLCTKSDVQEYAVYYSDGVKFDISEKFGMRQFILCCRQIICAWTNKETNAMLGITNRDINDIKVLDEVQWYLGQKYLNATNAF